MNRILKDLCGECSLCKSVWLKKRFSWRSCHDAASEVTDVLKEPGRHATDITTLSSRAVLERRHGVYNSLLSPSWGGMSQQKPPGLLLQELVNTLKHYSPSAQLCSSWNHDLTIPTVTHIGRCKIDLWDLDCFWKVTLYFKREVARVSLCVCMCVIGVSFASQWICFCCVL